MTTLSTFKLRLLRKGGILLSLLALSIEGSAAQRVIGGGRHTCAIDSLGQLWCAGENFLGQLGNGTIMSSPIPVEAKGIVGKVIDASLSFEHSCALTDQGTIYCFGNNYRGQLGNGENKNESAVPVLVEPVEKFTQVSVGASHTCALGDSGTVYCFGLNSAGQLGDGTNIDRSLPVKVKLEEPAKQISLGSSHTCIVGISGTLYCHGRNGNRQLGYGDTFGYYPIPQAVPDMPEKTKAVFAGASHTCVIGDSGRAYCVGKGDDGRLGLGEKNHSYFTPLLKITEQLATIAQYWGTTYFTGESGKIYVSGRGKKGQLGLGILADIYYPAEVPTLPENITQMSAGGEHACAVGESGTVYCFGRGEDGQLGTGSTPPYETAPVKTLFP